MNKEKIILGKQYTLDMGQHVKVIPRRVLTEGIDCDYVMSSPGRKELIKFNIWEMNGFDVSDYSIMNLNPIDLWEPTGLLNGVDNTDKEKLANLYSSMADYIINLEYENETLNNIIFPIIYRIIKSGSTINNVTDLYDDASIFVESNFEDVTTFSNNYDFYIDVDAELIGMYVEYYLNDKL